MEVIKRYTSLNLFTLLTVLFVFGCNPDQKRHSKNSDSNVIEQNTFFPTTTTPSQLPNPQANENNNSSDDYLYIPTGAANCNWSRDGQTNFLHKHKHLSPTEEVEMEGHYNICQSTSDSSYVYLQIQHPIQDHQICIIPTVHQAEYTTYIGEPRCASLMDHKKIYSFKIFKNRQGYQNQKMTGVMIMRNKSYQYDSPFNRNLLSTDAFLYCNEWLAVHKSPVYCNSFKKGQHYIYHQF